MFMSNEYYNIIKINFCPYFGENYNGMNNYMQIRKLAENYVMCIQKVNK